MRQTNLKGITGQISFTKKGDVASAKYVVIETGKSADANKIVKVLDVAAPDT
ncbi:MULTISPECIES: hypothetical protein [unclassified Rhizobium]|uniref:hypothetical protein n=1 Tax=unclassified Rhizobium TaxID=2613769 RepID=UPI00160AA3DE|nr:MULTISPECIES: hypothetical protein [unclassified Rhizobium]MBB3289082.1 hypothetical protein [Rhizobium sp. BK252]MBB3403824.1 hypothetical protein [Rhizobium sp. BK289]MBB3416507.1 hypothetical protein [Rhizobium sp. BK284]MBB3484287.1 hypothetical protein [Rhizobium sp. BK347]